jgi:uncharacterized protein (TIGR02246 family)
MHKFKKYKEMNNEKIMALFDHWNNIIQTGNPKTVTNLYQIDAVLLPTTSNKFCHNYSEIEEYFRQFLENIPKCNIHESKIQNLGEIIIHSGIYIFSFKDYSKIKARFSFVYQWNGQDWKIIEHHSSEIKK